MDAVCPRDPLLFFFFFLVECAQCREISGIVYPSSCLLTSLADEPAETQQRARNKQLLCKSHCDSEKGWAIMDAGITNESRGL